MICNYSKCDEEAGVYRRGTKKKYCTNEHRKLGRAELRPANHKNDLYLTDLELEERSNSKKLIESALKGSLDSQRALKEQGLKYHYRRNEGEWGVASGK